MQSRKGEFDLWTSLKPTFPKFRDWWDSLVYLKKEIKVEATHNERLIQ